MASNQDHVQVKHNEQAGQVSDTAKVNTSKAAQNGEHIIDAARDGLNKVFDLREQTAEKAKQIVQRSVESVSRQAHEATDRFTRTLGFSSDDSEQLARRSHQNLEAVTRCGTVLTQALQDASRHWFELGQKQWRHSLDGVNKLTRAKSVQEFAAIQSELVRESLQHMVQDSRTIAETSARAIEEASKTFSGMTKQSPAVAR
jgi:hypothetical protein